MDCNYCLDINILYICKYTYFVFERFKNQYQFVMAAGGLVKNKRNSVLMIYKNDIWDLPKGKIDNGELASDAAIREVYEETNVKDLNILPGEHTTHHMYNISRSILFPRMVLKETTWFLMESKSAVKLMPQLEESITKVAWIPVQNIKTTRTYESIKVVFGRFMLNFFNNGSWKEFL